MGGEIVKYFYRMGPRIGIKVQKRSKIRSEEKRTECAPPIHPRRGMYGTSQLATLFRLSVLCLVFSATAYLKHRKPRSPMRSR